MKIQRLNAAAIMTAVVVAASASSAVAGGCRSTECYVKVKQADTYATVARSVVVSPARADVVTSPAVMGYRYQRLETTPGYVTSYRQPAQYGAVARSVMVQPGRVSHTIVPAQYRTEVQAEVVRHASYRWEMKADAHGRMVKCKVEVPAVTRHVARQVMVSPAHTVAHTTPAVYKTVHQPLLLAPARTVQNYAPATYTTVKQPMLIKPATQHMVHQPAVMGVRHEQVLVRQGGYAWQPTSRSHARHW